jgi:hypothetical protein
MIATLICSAASAVVSAIASSVVTRYYFPKIIQIEKIVEKIVEPRRAPPAFSNRPIFLSAEERREAIAARAYDPSVLDQVMEGIRRRNQAFGGIAPDPEAQINPNWKPVKGIR